MIHFDTTHPSASIPPINSAQVMMQHFAVTQIASRIRAQKERREILRVKLKLDEHPALLIPHICRFELLVLI